MNTQGKVPTKTGGFTLIELMIVVAIIGVIAAVAFPSYKKSMMKSNRSDAKVSLVSMGQVLERCYTQSFSYKNCSGVTPTPSPATSQKGYYALTVPSVATSTYTVQAAAISSKGQANDTGCTTMTLDNNGNKNPASCW